MLLKMTSLMDILTVLLLFLLKSFVIEGEVVTPASGLNLPESTSETMPKESVVLAIIGNTVSLGDHVVARVVDASREGLLIDSLADALQSTRKRQIVLARRRGEEPQPAQLTIQGDKEMAFQLLQRVMYTCNQAGFDDISLAVLRSS
jgi:biopolymer transport protein ExbD